MSGGKAMTPKARAVLQQIGEALDGRRPVEVHDHGLIGLGGASPAPVQENDHGKRQRQGGPAAGSRSRPAGRKGKADRKAASGSRIGDLRAAYEEQLGKLKEAYPSLEVYPDDHGMWLKVQSSVIDGLDRKATFLVALPFITGICPIGWAFWSSDEDHRWIGPRHTNFFNGSVCAFAESDNVWSPGGDLRTLIDLYSAWAFRHLHLEIIGRWPGRQHALTGHEAYYRRTEFKDDELCSCPSGLRYGECCRPADMTLNGLLLKQAFEAAMGGGLHGRAPPRKIVDFIDGRAPLRAMKDVHIPLWNALVQRPSGVKEKN